MPGGNEKKHLAVLEAQHEYDGFRGLHEITEDKIKHTEEMIKDYTEELKREQHTSAELAEQLLKWGLEIADLSKQ